jgi:cytidylate kinase
VPIIAIDGPGGSGKSTVARAISDRLSIDRLDTGAMYRTVALLALRAGVDIDDGAALGRLAQQMDLELGECVVVDGDDVTSAIREPRVDAAVSIVAAHPEVRRELVRRQRDWVRGRDVVVVEGRDITSVVFPDAEVRIFLTASAEERALRRTRERHDATTPPDCAHVASTRSSILARDAIDSSRTDSPLVVAPGATLIDSTGRTVDEVVEEIVALL